MKKNLFLSLFLCGIFISCSNENAENEYDEASALTRATVSYPNTGTNGMFGFAAAANVTGGASGEVVYVTTLSELSEQVAGSTVRTVVIAANITASSKTKVQFGSNKSIIGSYSANTLHNIYLQATSTSGNVIFQNLTLSHGTDINANDDIQMYLNYGTGYWIDHCTFSGHDYDAAGSDVDKLLYVGVYADYITISTTKFMNHRYGLILGYPDDGQQATYDGYPRMSIFNNYFENVYTRGPGLMRYGHFHVKNNYINNFKLGFTIAQNARIYSEGNYFGTGASLGGILDDKENGSFTDVGSYPTITGQKSPQTSFVPSNSYSGYVVQTAEYARQFALSWAGAQSSSSTWVFGY